MFGHNLYKSEINNNNVFTFRFDSNTGVLSSVSGGSFVAPLSNQGERFNVPLFLFFDPSGKYAYGGTYRFSVDPNGLLVPIQQGNLELGRGDLVFKRASDLR